MNKETIAMHLFDTIKDFFAGGFLSQDSYSQWLKYAGIPNEELEAFLTPKLLESTGNLNVDLETFLTPHLVDGEEKAFFDESLLYKKLVSDDDFRLAIDTLMDSSPEELARILKTNVPRPKEKISRIDISKDMHYWNILINNKMLLKIPTRDENSYWGHIYKIADKEGKSEVQNSLAKGVLSWFNSNITNPIYKGSPFQKTKILRYASDFLYAEDGISIKHLSKRRLDEKRRS